MLAKSKLTANPKRQIDSFLAKYDPAIAAFARRVLVRMRKRLLGAVELVYDNYNGLVIGFGPNDRASLAIFSIVLFPRWVTLCFLQGAGLPDPQRRLQGEGRVVSVRDDPYVQKLMNLALRRAKVTFDPKCRQQSIIKSISTKQRPRKPLPKQ